MINQNQASQITQNTLSRKHFLKLLASLNILFVSDFVLRNNLFGKDEYRFNNNEDSVDQQMKFNIAIARALAHRPPQQYSQSFKDANEYEIKRTAAITLLANKAYLSNDFFYPSGVFSELVLNPNPEGLYKALSSEIPSVDLFKQSNGLDKDMVSALGTSISGVTGLAGMLFPEVSIPMAVGGAVGSGISVRSSFMQDKASRQIVCDSSLLLAQTLWSDTSAKKIMTSEVKAVLKDAFGVDFGASIEEHRKYCSTEIKEYIDVYLNNRGLSPEKLQARENETLQTVSLTVNKSVDKAVGRIINEMKAQQQTERDKQTEKRYYDGEIRGGVYLLNVIAEHFMSPQSARIVNVIGESAVQMDMMITALSMGALGPVGMAAGCVLIALNLLGVFGSKGPSADQLIMEAIGKMQESIFVLHKEMRELLGIVIENQQKMMQRIDSQFELLKRKQEEALRNLQEINEDLKLSISEDRIRGRNLQSSELLRKIQSLNTQINKRLNADTQIEKNKIEEVIEECYIYAIKTTKYDDFTSLPNPDEAVLHWDASKVINVFKTADLVDHFVGMIPLILSRFSPKQAITTINNPKGLGRAAMAMSTAYCMFPEIARNFEARKLHFIKEINLLIANTKKSLLISVSKETINSFKKSYLEIVSKILNESLKIGEQMTCRSNNIKEENGINLLVVGPLREISSVISIIEPFKQKSWFPDNSTLEKDILKRDVLNTFDNNPLTLDYLPEFKNISWKGADENPEIVMDNTALFKFLETLGIIETETGVNHKQQILIRTKFHNEPGAPYPVEVANDYSAEENWIAKKLTIHHPNGDSTILGDGVNSGWIKGTISKQKKHLTGISQLPPEVEYAIDNSEYNIEYISKDLLSDPYVGGSSITFLNKLKDEVNLFYKLRNQLIENTKSVINDDHNSLSLEFEAASMCLKYLAGISIYVKTGNVELGTSVSKDKVAGINVYMNENSEGSVIKKKDRDSLLSNRQHLSDLISKVSNSEYVTNSMELKSKGEYKIQLKDHIKNEVLDIADKKFEEYASLYFNEDINSFSLPELTMSQLMLAYAEKFIKKNI